MAEPLPPAQVLAQVLPQVVPQVLEQVLAQVVGSVLTQALTQVLAQVLAHALAQVLIHSPLALASELVLEPPPSQLRLALFFVEPKGQSAVHEWAAWSANFPDGHLLQSFLYSGARVPSGSGVYPLEQE